MTMNVQNSDQAERQKVGTHLTAAEHKEFDDLIIKFSVPTNALAVMLTKVILLLQFTIIGSILWSPWNGGAFAKYIVGFLLGVDFVRVGLSSDLRALVFGGNQVLMDVRTAFDDTFKTDRYGLMFIPLYIGVVIVSGIFSRIYLHFPDFAKKFYDIFVDVRHLHGYGFHSVGYKDFSFLFLTLLHSVTFLYLLFASTRTIKLYNFRTLSTSKKVYVGPSAAPLNISRYLTSIPFLVALAIGLHAVLAPRLITVPGNQYDWAGPIAMIIYSLCEYFIVSVTQIFNRYAILPIQARCAKTQEKE